MRGGARGAMVLAILALVPVAGAAQEPPRPAASPSPAPATVRRTGPTFAVRAGAPLTLSASAGLIVGRVTTGGASCPTAVGNLVQAEAGVGGGQVSLGRVFFTYCYTPFGSLGAADVKLTLLRTWGKPLFGGAGRTYLGPELDIGMADWKISLGLLARVQGDPASGRVRFVWGLGRGF